MCVDIIIADLIIILLVTIINAMITAIPYT